MDSRTDDSLPTDLDPTRESISRVLGDPEAYVARARARAALLRSPSQLLVVVLGFTLAGLIWFYLASGLRWLHWYPAPPPHPRFGLTRSELGGILLAVSPFFASIGPALVLANLIARLIRPWGRRLDLEAEAIPGADYGSSQRGLVRLSTVLMAIAVPFMAAGVLLGR